MRGELSNSRIGQIEKNSVGSLMEVIEYNNHKDIWVRFIENSNLVHTNWGNFIRGHVNNPYDRRTHGVGYKGEGEYKFTFDGGKTKSYTSWKNMMYRCYSKELHKKHATYSDCTVCEEWHNFQVFAKWYEENYYGIDGEKMNLDKDILKKGNKVYSPDTCVFVPVSINNLFLKKDANRGDLPIGVSFNKQDKIYIAGCSTNNKGIIEYLGSYNNPCDAYRAYKEFKEKLIKQIAVKYKGKIPNKLYDAMMKYTVEIYD